MATDDLNDWIASVTVDVPDDAGPATVTASAVERDGIANPVATWTVSIAEGAALVVSRSPDR